MTRLLLAAVLSLVVAFLSGCGESVATVSGKVTLDDKPLPGGTVVFAGEERQAQAPIQPDGTYSATNVPLGNAKVAVLPPPPSPSAAMPKGVAPSLPPGVPKDSPQAQIYLQAGQNMDVPAAVKDPNTSNLTLNVDGSKTYDIPLKSGS